MVNARRVVGGLIGTARFLGRAGRELAGRAARGLAEEAKVVVVETKKIVKRAKPTARKFAIAAGGTGLALGARSRVAFGIKPPKKRKKKRKKRKEQVIVIGKGGRRTVVRFQGRKKPKAPKRKKRRGNAGRRARAAFGV